MKIDIGYFAYNNIPMFTPGSKTREHSQIVDVVLSHLVELSV